MTAARNKKQKQVRNREQTRARILGAAKCVFTERGFEGARMSEIARRAHASKQLVHHHFGSKEHLFQQVHELEFRPQLQWHEVLPDDPQTLIAERFKKRAEDVDYTRFLTWEAASEPQNIPGLAVRRKRLQDTSAVLQNMQRSRIVPPEVDCRLLQLAIIALSTYPLAFKQNAKLVTGLDPTGENFQRQWYRFLHHVGKKLFNPQVEKGEAAASNNRNTKE